MRPAPSNKAQNPRSWLVFMSLIVHSFHHCHHLLVGGLRTRNSSGFPMYQQALHCPLLGNPIVVACKSSVLSLRPHLGHLAFSLIVHSLSFHILPYPRLCCCCVDGKRTQVRCQLIEELLSVIVGICRIRGEGISPGITPPSKVLSWCPADAVTI